MTTPTPRTDKHMEKSGAWSSGYWIEVWFAQELERDLAAREAELAEWKYRAQVYCDEGNGQRARAEAAERERDLAIAHDRQPYPTAAAYEAVCKARNKWQERAEAAKRELAAMKAENSKLRSALEIVHFKREPWQ